MLQTSNYTLFESLSLDKRLNWINWIQFAQLKRCVPITIAYSGYCTVYCVLHLNWENAKWAKWKESTDITFDFLVFCSLFYFFIFLMTHWIHCGLGNLNPEGIAFNAHTHTHWCQNMILITSDLSHDGKFEQLLKKRKIMKEHCGCNGIVINSS